VQLLRQTIFFALLLSFSASAISLRFDNDRGWRRELNDGNWAFSLEDGSAAGRRGGEASDASSRYIVVTERFYMMNTSADANDPAFGQVQNASSPASTNAEFSTPASFLASQVAAMEQGDALNNLNGSQMIAFEATVESLVNGYAPSFASPFAMFGSSGIPGTLPQQVARQIGATDSSAMIENPEPGTWLLFGSGALLFLLRRRA
jgi:hypothetical protein